MPLKNLSKSLAYPTAAAAAAATILGALVAENVVTNLGNVLAPVNYLVHHDVDPHQVLVRFGVGLLIWAGAWAFKASSLRNWAKRFLVNVGAGIFALSTFFLVLSWFVPAPVGLGVDVANGMMVGVGLAQFAAVVLQD